jgi:hypothetical protein
MSPERRFDVAHRDFEVTSKRPLAGLELNIEVLLICVAWLRVIAWPCLSGYALRTKFRVFSQTSISVDDVAMRLPRNVRDAKHGCCCLAAALHRIFRERQRHPPPLTLLHDRLTPAVAT